MTTPATEPMTVRTAGYYAIGVLLGSARQAAPETALVLRDAAEQLQLALNAERGGAR